MATLTTTAKVVVQATHTTTAASTDLAVSTGASAYVEKIIEIALASGTGAGNADQMFSDRRTIAASSSESLDLAGAVTDFVGTTFTFAKVKLILVTAATTNTNDVLVGNGGTNPWSALLAADGEVALKPGDGFMAWANTATNSGWAVGAGSSDILFIANSGSGTEVVYDIVIIGASA